MLVFSLKASSFAGSVARSTAIGPIWRQEIEKFDGSSLSPSGWPQPPLRAWEIWQTMPGTRGSSKSLTQTLSLGESRLNVVLTQARSSARAGRTKTRADPISRIATARENRFMPPSVARAPATRCEAPDDPYRHDMVALGVEYEVGG